MKEKRKILLIHGGKFAGILLLAIAVSAGFALTNFPAWAQAALVFVGTKIASDFIVALYRKERRFLYFEDYLREVLMFMIVAALGIVGFMAVERYMGGVVWVPLLAAALVLIWRK